MSEIEPTPTAAERELQRLEATAPYIDPHLEAPSLDELLAGTRPADALRRVERVVEWLLAEESDGDNGGYSDGFAAGQRAAGERVRRALDGTFP